MNKRANLTPPELRNLAISMAKQGATTREDMVEALTKLLENDITFRRAFQKPHQTEAALAREAAAPHPIP